MSSLTEYSLPASYVLPLLDVAPFSHSRSRLRLSSNSAPAPTRLLLLLLLLERRRGGINTVDSTYSPPFTISAASRCEDQGADDLGRWAARTPQHASLTNTARHGPRGRTRHDRGRILQCSLPIWFGFLDLVVRLFLVLRSFLCLLLPGRLSLSYHLPSLPSSRVLVIIPGSVPYLFLHIPFPLAQISSLLPLISPSFRFFYLCTICIAARSLQSDSSILTILCFESKSKSFHTLPLRLVSCSVFSYTLFAS
jgi:hypothetical protein